MAHVNIYLPDEVADSLRREATKSHQSLSRYVLTLVTARKADRWPKGYFKDVCGFLKEEIAPPADPLPEPVDDL